MKLVANLVLGASITAVGEALALGEALGLGWTQLQTEGPPTWIARRWWR